MLLNILCKKKSIKKSIKNLFNLNNLKTNDLEIVQCDKDIIMKLKSFVTRCNYKTKSLMKKFHISHVHHLSYVCSLSYLRGVLDPGGLKLSLYRV